MAISETILIDADVDYLRKFGQVNDEITTEERRGLLVGAQYLDLQMMYHKQAAHPELHRTAIIKEIYDLRQFADGLSGDEKESRKLLAEKTRDLSCRLAGKQGRDPMDFSFLKSLFLTDKTKEDINNVVTSAWAKNPTYTAIFIDIVSLIECAQVEVLLIMSKDRNMSPNDSVQLLSRKIMGGDYKRPVWFYDYEIYKRYD